MIPKFVSVIEGFLVFLFGVWCLVFGTTVYICWSCHVVCLRALDIISL